MATEDNIADVLMSSEPSPTDVAEQPMDVTASWAPSAASLDVLPLEILMAVASWLDWRSLQSLERVSSRCRDAVALHLGRLRVFSVSRAELGGTAPSGAQLRRLLARLTALRQLHVRLVADWVPPRELLEALAGASPCWPRLERLAVHWYGYGCDEHLLGELCRNCPRLEDVSLAKGAACDAVVRSVLAARPMLRVLCITDGLPRILIGTFLSHLPTQLLRLVVDCRAIHSAEVAALARCGELRSLQLLQARGLRPGHLSAGLSGCPRLERLTLTGRDGSVSGCLPPDGLPALSYLDLTGCHLTDADLSLLLQRLPGLQHVSLARCSGPTQRGLSLLGRLPMLGALDLVGTDGVSDWTLSSLCAAPLVELQLGDGGPALSAALSPEGLMALHRGCPTLRRLTLWADAELAEQVECGPGVDESRLLRWLKARVWKMTEMAMFGKMVPTHRRGWGHFLL